MFESKQVFIVIKMQHLVTGSAIRFMHNVIYVCDTVIKIQPSEESNIKINCNMGWFGTYGYPAIQSAGLFSLHSAAFNNGQLQCPTVLYGAQLNPAGNQDVSYA